MGGRGLLVAVEGPGHGDGFVRPITAFLCFASAVPLSRCCTPRAQNPLGFVESGGNRSILPRSSPRVCRATQQTLLSSDPAPETTLVEVPDHLLQRSAEARSRLSGEPDAADGDAQAAPAGAAATASPAVPAPPTAPAAVPAEPVVKFEAPVPPYVTAALQRKTIPYWVMPVLLFLPIWAIYYVGYLERPPADPEGLLFEGGEVYAEVCASCHGGTGSGGTGRQLNGGEVLLTFPSDAAGYDGLAGHIAWVANGSDQTEITEGPQYGDPARIGTDSPRTVGSFGAAMGNFTESLTVEELAAVVYYERVAHGDIDDETAAHELEVLEEFVHLNEEAGVSNLALGVSVAEVSTQLDDARAAVAAAHDEVATG